MKFSKGKEGMIWIDLVSIFSQYENFKEFIIVELKIIRQLMLYHPE